MDRVSLEGDAVIEDGLGPDDWLGMSPRSRRSVHKQRVAMEEAVED
jgi:hypothetical protein